MRVDYYFMTTPDHFWRWSQDGESSYLMLYNGRTIAHKILIANILEEFGERNVPPFESLLMAILATNNNGEENIKALVNFFDGKSRSVAMAMGSKSAYHDDLIAFLRRLTELPEVYRTGHKRTQMLLAIFENAHNSVRLGRDVNIKEVLFEAPFSEKVNNPNIVFRGLQTVAHLNAKFPTVTSLIEHIERTIEVEETFDLDNPLQGFLTDEEFIEDLGKRTEAQFISYLIPNIWSGLHIPSNTQLPSQQPLGGVADISNKGNFDRLLLSEFANDDDVFLSRLANNEALYIEREIPPSNQENNKVILLDVSIKNWGTPKQISYAIQIALTKKDDGHNYESYAVGDTIMPIKTDTVQSYIDSLGHVSCTADARLGLEQFFKEHENLAGSEVVFISRKIILEDPDFQQVMSEYRSFFKYLIAVEPDGAVDLYHYSAHAKRHLQGFKLNLKSPSPVSQKMVLGAYRYDFPILFRPMSHLKFIGVTDQKYLLVSKNGHVFSKDTGALSGVRYLPIPPLVGNSLRFAMGAIGRKDFLAYYSERNKVHLFDLKTLAEFIVSDREWESDEEKILSFDEESFFKLESIKKGWQVNDEGVVYGSWVKNTSFSEFDGLKELHLATRRKKITSNSPMNAYKKARRIYINSIGQLCINRHILITRSNALVLENRSTEVQISARRKRNKFIFPNGYEVHYLPEGMIVLRFKDVHTIHFLGEISQPNLVAKANENYRSVDFETVVRYLETAPSFGHLATSMSQLENDKLQYVVAGDQITVRHHDFYDVFLHTLLNTKLSAATKELFTGSSMYEDTSLGQQTVEPALFYGLFIDSFVKAIIHEA